MWNQGDQAEFVHQAQQLWQHAAQHAGDQSMPHAADVAAAWQQWADALSEGAGRVAHDLVLPAYAAEVALDPNTTYLYGADGAVLVDPMNNNPISDDWWNGFIGFQSELIKSIDAKLRGCRAGLRLDHRFVHGHQAFVLPLAAVTVAANVKEI
ncbi:unnamed protein product [Effrenium voratum]|nr:unnamed protein product [Effrenium voratum]